MVTKIAQEEAVAHAPLPEVKRNIPLKELVMLSNVADKLTEEERAAFGLWVVDGYLKDLGSRTEWEQRNGEAIKLALQVKEVKSFPWTNCANVKFPLVTIAALQFLARISILTKGRRIARYEAVGKDPEGKKALQAARISEHTSMQLTDQEGGWQDMDEQTKFSASLLGCAFKKTDWDPIQGSICSEFIAAQNFVFDYHCQNLHTTSRATHIVPMSSNKLRERIRRKLFIEEEVHRDPAPATTPDLLGRVKDEVQGVYSHGPLEDVRVLEQHCWFDFDGDGYAEPYIMSVREDTGHLYRIVARYFDVGDVHRMNDLAVRQAESLAEQATDAETTSKYEKQAQRLQDATDNYIVRIDAQRYFTKYVFIPSPDGGAYGLGFGALLGPVNQTVNTLINQLLDSGTMSTTAGGFLGRGVKLKGGKTSFDPFEWKPVDSTGDDLRKNIVPLPVNAPSDVLLKLLGILIQYGEKIGSATDIMTGVSPGQNTPAETSRNTVEQGMMLFSGIYARMYRSFSSELSKIYDLNRLYLHTSPQFFELAKGPDAIISPSDYSSSRFRIYPVADPSAVSGEQRKQKADKLVAFSNSPNGMKLDKDVITRKWLEAHEYEDIDLIFPDPKGPNAIQPPPNPKMQELQQKAKEHEDEMQLEVVRLKKELELEDAKIAELEAKAQMELAKADSSAKEAEIGLLNAQIGAAKAKSDQLRHTADLLLRAHIAKTSTEKTIHDMTMDVHDRGQQAQQMKLDAAQQGASGDSANQ